MSVDFSVKGAAVGRPENGDARVWAGEGMVEATARRVDHQHWRGPLTEGAPAMPGYSITMATAPVAL